jgi:hypothetical protein
MQFTFEGVTTRCDVRFGPNIPLAVEYQRSLISVVSAAKRHCGLRLRVRMVAYCERRTTRQEFAQCHRERPMLSH